MTKTELFSAFGDAVSADFADIPTDESEITLEFSDDFEKNFKALAKRQSKSYYPLINTAAKRAAVIAVCVVSILSVSVMSVDAAREAVLDFFVKISDGITTLFVEGDTDEKVISSYYYPGFIPSGFEETFRLRDETCGVYSFEDADGNFISFSQYPAYTSQHSYETEKLDSKEVTVGEKECLSFEKGGNSYYLWREKSYTFEIHSNLSGDKLYEVITSVKEEQP